MPLDPVIKRLIAISYKQGFGEIHKLNSEQMRKFLTHPKNSTPEYSQKEYYISKGIKVNKYSPKNKANSDTLGALIFFPAQGYAFNLMNSCQSYCTLLATKLNMHVIHVEPRQAPEHKFPTFVLDSMRCIKWIYTNHKILSINPDKIAIWGESAGGHYVAICTNILRDEGLDYIKYQVLAYPTVDTFTHYPSREKYANGYMLDKTFIEWMDEKSFKPFQDKREPWASPIFFPSFKNLPSTTMILAKYDPLYDEGMAYAKKLARSAVNVKISEYSGMIHGFLRFFNKVAEATDAINSACDDIITHLLQLK